MTSDASRSARNTLLLVTFVVSFCSFAYEFVYSELLTVMYGGTVTQYTITVGLYFFSLGIGSALSDDLDGDRRGNFVRAELYLMAVAPVGFLLVVALNGVTVPKEVPRLLLWCVARSPVVAVGFLSGFELPLLTQMLEASGADESVSSGRLARARRRLHGVALRAVSPFFAVDRREGERSGLSLVLAMDYVGGLAGAVVYARVLYPRLGLIPTIFALALLNGVAALAFAARFGGRDWLPTVPDDGRPIVASKAIIAACLVLTAIYGGVLVDHDRVDDAVSDFYLQGRIESEFAPGAMSVTVTDHYTTKYQQVTEYERTWTGTGPNPYFDGTTETCMRLGTAVQLCDSWADSYHQGLVDVPMSMYPNGSATRVLIVGGGDYIAVDHLREYGVTVDQVDLDREFLRRAKRDPYLTQYNHGAWRYDRLNTTVADGYAYLRNSTKTYDVILLDIPGAKDDDLLHLYSTEFYRAMRDNLAEDGVVVTWTYSRYGYTRHHEAYLNTVRAAGYDRYAPYWAWEDLNGDGQTDRVERFYVLSPDGGPTPERSGSAYVDRHWDRYGDVRWRPVPHFDGVRPNSVFHPNYDILIED